VGFRGPLIAFEENKGYRRALPEMDVPRGAWWIRKPSLRREFARCRFSGATFASYWQFGVSIRESNVLSKVRTFGPARRERG